MESAGDIWQFAGAVKKCGIMPLRLGKFTGTPYKCE
jgi:hypothetical protein